MEAGAVFDRPFDPSHRSADRVITDSVGASIERLVERGLLAVSDGDPVAATHVLIRDVAYAGLPRAQRAELHRAVADWMIGASPDPRTGASRADRRPLSRGRDAGGQARATTLRAGRHPRTGGGVADARRRRALSAAASTEAVDRLRAAVEIAAPQEQAAIYERMGDADLNAQTSLEGYRRALTTHGGAQRRTRGLRVTGKLLLLVTRSWGGVANGPSKTEMDESAARRREPRARARTRSRSPAS